MIRFVFHLYYLLDCKQKCVVFTIHCPIKQTQKKRFYFGYFGLIQNIQQIVYHQNVIFVKKLKYFFNCS
jgi:hypothetical protein